MKSKMTLSDLGILLEIWGLSYNSTVSSERINLVANSSKEATSGYLTSIVDKYFTHRIADETIIQKMIIRSTAICYEWAFLSFAIGAERHAKNIEDRMFPKYLKTINSVLATHLIEYLEPLVRQKKISEKQYNAMVSDLELDLETQSEFLFTQGFLSHSEMLPRYGNNQSCPFVVKLESFKVD